MTPTKTSLLALLAALPLAACGEPGASEEMRESDGEANAPGTYIPEEAVTEARTDRYDGFADEDVAGQDGMARSPDIIDQDTRDRMEGEAGLRRVVEDDRRAEAMARDGERRPAQTLTFFGLEPDMTVVEVWPGGGYYADILAPYLAERGRYYAVANERPGGADRYRERFADEGRYGRVEIATLGAERGLDGVPDGSADMVLTFRNVHNFTMGGYGERAFQGFYDALKPGGILGVVEHRLPEDYDDAMMESSGYMKTSTVIELAEAAGFELAEESELNANPKDTADHPFGVWTLPPRSVTEDRQGNAPEGFDAARYAAIGESDRMTLRFVKPIGADGALLE